MLQSIQIVTPDTAQILLQDIACFYQCPQNRLVKLLGQKKKLVLRSGARLYLQNKPRKFILETTRLDGIDVFESLYGRNYRVYVDGTEIGNGFVRFHFAQNYMLELINYIDAAHKINVRDAIGICEEWTNLGHGWRGWKRKGV